jgi:hypothetical protein
VIDAATRALATGRALDVGLHALRLLPVTALSPFLGGPLLPAPARLALALALGAVAASGALAPVPIGGADLVMAAARELALATAGRIAPRAGFPDAAPSARAAAGLAAVALSVAALSGRLVEIAAAPVAILRRLAGGLP